MNSLQPNGTSFEDKYKLDTESSEHEKVFQVLCGIAECLRLIGADTLTTFDHWAKLYLFLSMKHEIPLEEKPMHPRSFTDLVYKTKLLFHYTSGFTHTQELELG
jgi:hypothetical protein